MRRSESTRRIWRIHFFAISIKLRPLLLRMVTPVCMFVGDAASNHEPCV